MASGTAGAQTITIAFAPIITRIYGPEAFGLLGTFTASLAVLVPLTALAYPIAIPLPRHDSDALNLARLSFRLSFILSLLAAGIIWLYGGWLTTTLSIEPISEYLLLIPVAMIFSAWTQISQQWLIRKKGFGVIARSAVAYSLILNTAKSAAGWLYPTGAVLITLATLGSLIHTLLMLFGIRKNYKPVENEADSTSPRGITKTIYQYRDFPIYRAPQIFINSASRSLPIILLSSFFGPATAGFYTLARTVMGMPSSMIGKAVSDVFYPHITELAHKGGDLPRYIIKATAFLTFISLVPFTLIFAFGPWMFGLVFGEEWSIAGDYARWLAFFYLFNFINKPAVAAVPVLGIQRGLLIYEIFSTGIKVVGLFLGFYWFRSDTVAIALFSLTGAAAYMIMISWIINIAKYHKPLKTS